MGKILLFLILIGTFSFAYAEEEEILLLKAISEEPPNTLEGLPRPKPGMTRENVTKVFGKPKKTGEPVGRPPIVKWYYENYVVYFEGDFVINTVMKKPKFE